MAWSEWKRMGYKGELYFQDINCDGYATYAGYFGKTIIVNIQDYKKITIGSVSVNHETRYACVLGDNNEVLFQNNVGSNIEIDISNHSTVVFCVYATSGYGNSSAYFTEVTIS